MPEFRRLAGDAEGRIHRLVAVVAVIHEVQIAIGQLAMHKEKARVALRLGVVEVRRHLQGVEDIRQALARVHRAFAHLVHARAVAKQFVVQLLELRLVVGEAGIVGGLRTGHDGAILHQFVNGAQHRQRHVLAVGIKPQHAVAHAALGGDAAVRRRSAS